ncbi:hypothetical protein RHSIM_Rhsim01G0270800 [Rhododendron simsii]|uniref:EF-hand domain-containing protein n=1 Tax=Rhododendron simsii TaxID=118357 RepID=A0A834HEG7_RHOSS|nr:hypothetical protein RHSIM_Rhsim01G0270800 [Rhododendron simsii]
MGTNQANIFAALPPMPVLASAAWVKAGLFRFNQRSLTSLGDMDEVQKVFNKFNTNGNGKISVFRDLGFDAGTSSVVLTDAVTVIDKDGAIDLH